MVIGHSGLSRRPSLITRAARAGCSGRLWAWGLRWPAVWVSPATAAWAGPVQRDVQGVPDMR